MNPTSPLDKEPFSFQEFRLMCESVYKRSAAEVAQYLASAAVKQILKPKMNEIFEAHESNPIEAWTRAKITNFKSDNSIVTNELTEMMNTISKSTNISIFKVYQYIDDLKRVNPALSLELQKPGYLIQNQSFIENLVVENFHNERMAYLHGIYALVTLALDDADDARVRVASNFLNDLINSHDFFSNMFSNLRTLHKEKASDYMKRNPEIYVLGKLKEQYLILNIVYKLLISGRVERQAENEFEGFFSLFLEQKFAGIIGATNDDIFLSVNSSHRVKDLASDNAMCQLFISLAFLFSNHSLANNTITPSYLKYLQTIASKGINLLINNEDLLMENSNLAFFSTTFYSYISVIINSCGRIDSDATIRLDNIMSKDHADVAMFYADHISEVLQSLKMTKLAERNEYRQVLRHVLEHIWMYSKNNPDDTGKMFRDEQTFNNILLLLFKEVMKSENILAEYWNQDDSTRGIREIAANWLSGFPYNTSNFISTVEILLGNERNDNVDTMVEGLSSVDRLTMEVSGKVNGEVYQVRRNAYNDTQDEVYKLLEPTVVHDEFELPKDTSYIVKGDRLYEFEVGANFWEFFLRNIFKHLNALQRDAFTPPAPQFYDYLRLLCKIVIYKPNAANKIESYGLNDDTDTGVTHILFILMNSLRILYENVNEVKLSLMIIRALKSLVLSTNGEYTKFFIHAHAIFVRESGDITHPIVDIYRIFTSIEREVDLYRSNEKHLLQLLEETIGLLKLLVVDDDFWLSALKGTVSNEVPVLLDRTEERKILDEHIRDVNSLYQQSVFNDTWKSNAELMHKGITEIFDSRMLIQNTLVDTLWTNMILPLCRRFTKDDIDTTYHNIKLKYKIYNVLFDFLNVIYSKFIYTRSERTVWLGDTKDNINNLLYKRLVDYTKNVPLKEMIFESFEVLLDSDVLQNKRLGRAKNKIGVENKHYVYNVVQKDSKGSLNSIKNFLCSALRLLSTSLRVVTSVINEVPIASSIDFANDIFKSFCVRDTQFKYTFNNFSDQHEISIIIALISLLDLDNNSSTVESVTPLYNLRHCEWNIVNSLFEDDKTDPNKFIFTIDVDTLFAKGINNNINYRANKSLSALVFDTLSSLMILWKTQKRSSKPSLVDYIAGLYNELPVKSLIWHSFILHIHRSLYSRVEPALDFLLECSASQFSLIERIIKTEEVEVSSSTYNKFFDCLRGVIVTVRKTIDFEPENADVNNRIICKTIILGMQLFQSTKLSKSLVARHWDILTDTIVNGIFDYIDNKPQTLLSLEQAVYQQMENDAEAFNGLTRVPHAVNFNLIRTQSMADMELLFDKMMSLFIELFATHFSQKVLRGSSPLFDNTNRRDFTRRLKGSLINLLSHFISNETIYADIVIKKLLHQIIPNTISEVNKVCAPHTNPFVVHNSRALSKQAYYIDFMRDQSIDSWEYIFNPKYIYYTLRIVELPEDLTERLYLNCFLYNTLVSLNASKQRFQPQLVSMMKILNSVGLTGNLSGTSLVHIPFNDLASYINNVCYHLQLSDDLRFESYNDLLVQELKASLPTYGGVNAHNTSRNLINLHNLEKQSVLPFWTENNKFTNIIELYGEGVSLNTTYDNINNTTLTNLMDTIRGKITYMTNIISEYMRILRDETTDITIELSSSSNNWESLFELLGSYISVYAHMLVNSHTSIDDKQQQHPVEQLQEIIALLAKSIELITTDRSAKVTVAESGFKAIHLSMYCLRQLKASLSNNTLATLVELCISYLKNNTVNPERLIKIVEWLYEMAPGLVDTAHVSYFASRLTLKTVSLPEYRAIIDLFISICTQPQISNMIYNSKLINELSFVESIKSSANYRVTQLYVDNSRDDCHVRFCYLLQLFGILMHTYMEQPNFVRECINFITTYQPRFEMLLSLGTQLNDMSGPVQDVSTNVKTLAFVEELHYALPIISMLSREAEFWYKDSPSLYAKFLSYMINHSIRLFSHDPLATTSNLKVPDGGLVSDRFKPVDSFEKLLASIQINEKSGTTTYRPLDSVNRMTVNKNSVSSELNQFNNFKNLILYQSSFTNSLFSHKVEVLSQGCLFQLLTSIINMLERADYQLLLAKHADIFSEDTVKRLANNLNGCQLFIAFAHQKLHHYGDNFREGMIHLMLMHNTVEGYISTQGLVTSFPLLSVNETIHLVRKSFEFAYYLQVLLQKIANETDIKYKQYYNDGLLNCKEKAKIVLAEFMRFVEKPAALHSVSKESKRQHPTPSPFKSLQRFTPKNLSTTLPVISEEKSNTMLINKRSVEIHGKFLDSVQKLFQNK